MFLKNEDVKIGTIPDANGSDNPLKKMEFLTCLSYTRKRRRSLSHSSGKRTL